jgi:hypothetical protein
MARTVISRILRNQWLRPNGCNRAAMISQVEEAAAAGASHVEFMLHSSEFLPAGSPTFPDSESIERLYGDLEALFERASTLFTGVTLTEFRHAFDPPPRVFEQAMGKRDGAEPRKSDLPCQFRSNEIALRESPCTESNMTV